MCVFLLGLEYDILNVTYSHEFIYKRAHVKLLRFSLSGAPDFDNQVVLLAADNEISRIPA